MPQEVTNHSLFEKEDIREPNASIIKEENARGDQNLFSTYQIVDLEKAPSDLIAEEITSESFMSANTIKAGDTNSSKLKNSQWIQDETENSHFLNHLKSIATIACLTISGMWIFGKSQKNKSNSKDFAFFSSSEIPVGKIEEHQKGEEKELPLKGTSEKNDNEKGEGATEVNHISLSFNTKEFHEEKGKTQELSSHESKNQSPVQEAVDVTDASHLKEFEDKINSQVRLLNRLCNLKS